MNDGTMNDARAADAPDDPPRPPSPLQRYGVIETDRFCRKCGYNLHGLNVERDERLDILIIRCPECATFDAAGRDSSASNVWSARQALFNLLAWMGLLVLLLGFGTGGLIGLSVAHDDLTLLHHTLSASDTRYLIAGRPLANVLGRRQDEYIAILIGNILVPAACGVVWTVCFWHWRRKWYFILAFAIPLMLLAGRIVVEILDRPTTYNAAAFAWRFFLLGVQVCSILIGVMIGRPLARMVVRVLLPPSLRQTLAFLWRVDGKDLPTSPPDTSHP